MSDKSISSLRKQVFALQEQMNVLLDEIEEKSSVPTDGVDLKNEDQLISLMKERRIELGITLEDLEFQTNISASTLKRIFVSPDRVKFSSVVSVLKELGINTWAEK